jgi:Protein of unknown function (DUF4238)
MSDPKQHHYIPETYLENFCSEDRTLWLYDKWENRSFPSSPKKALKQHFYYAQPDHEQKAWNHNIENFFSEKVEKDWPSTVRLIQEGPDSLRSLRHFYMFLYPARWHPRPRRHSGDEKPDSGRHHPCVIPLVRLVVDHALSFAKCTGCWCGGGIHQDAGRLLHRCGHRTSRLGYMTGSVLTIEPDGARRGLVFLREGKSQDVGFAV